MERRISSTALLTFDEWPPDAETLGQMHELSYPGDKTWRALFPAAVVVTSNQTIRALSVKNIKGEPVFTEDVEGVFDFVDLAPGANWAHACIYAFAIRSKDIKR